MDRYANFDLVIDREGDQFLARVIDSPAGEATHAFSFPFSRLELENFLLRVGQSRRTVRRIDSPQMEAAREFGGKLYDTVFDGEVRTCFRRALDEADRQDQGLRVRVRFENALDMADLPWEYLYAQALGRFLVLSTRTPLVRYIDLPSRIKPLQISPPLKILVMVSSPTDYIDLDVEAEYGRLVDALSDLVSSGRVVLDRLDDANLSTLQKRLRQNEYHIFHYVGHGGYDEARDDGVLMLEDEMGRGRSVSGHELGTILHDHRSLRLAILNSCEGARTSTSDPFAGTAQSLIQQGIPAVVAMQFEISDDAAIVFAHEFYAAIADGYPVDAASAEARKAMFTSNPDVEWGTPVLNMRSPDGMVFEVTGDPIPVVEPPDIPPPPARPATEEREPDVTPEPAASTTTEPSTRAADSAEEAAPADVADGGSPTTAVPRPRTVGPDTEVDAAASAEPRPRSAPPSSSGPKGTDDPDSGLGLPGPPLDRPAGADEATPAPTTVAPGARVAPKKAKKGVPTWVWIGLAAAVAIVVVVGLIGAFLPEPDPLPPQTAAPEIVPPDDGGAAEAQPPPTAAPVDTAVRPGPRLVADEIFDFDADGFPLWDFDPTTLEGTPFVVFEDGWDGTEDLFTEWSFGWDPTFFYAQVFVEDDLYFQDQVGPTTFRGDSLNLDFDLDLIGDVDAAAPNGDDFQLLISAGTASSGPEAWLFQGNGSIFVDAPAQGVTAVRVFDESSPDEIAYVVDIAIPWAAMNVTPDVGDVFGFRVSANDNDVFEARQELMLSNVSGSSLFDTRTWGTLVLN